MFAAERLFVRSVAHVVLSSFSAFISGGPWAGRLFAFLGVVDVVLSLYMAPILTTYTRFSLRFCFPFVPLPPFQFQTANVLVASWSSCSSRFLFWPSFVLVCPCLSSFSSFFLGSPLFSFIVSPLTRIWPPPFPPKLAVWSPSGSKWLQVASSPTLFARFCPFLRLFQVLQCLSSSFSLFTSASLPVLAPFGRLGLALWLSVLTQRSLALFCMNLPFWGQNNKLEFQSTRQGENTVEAKKNESEEKSPGACCKGRKRKEKS